MADLKVRFYKCNSDKRKVGKSLEPKGEAFTVYTMGDMSETDPIFLFDNYNTIGEWRDINYLYFENLERYYYITSKTYDKRGLCRLECHVDVLETYKNHILGTTQLITRAESKKARNRYIVDNNMPIHSDNAYTIKQSGIDIINTLPPTLTDTESSALILATVGRGSLA